MPRIAKSGIKFDRSKTEEVKRMVTEDDTDYGALRKNFISDIPESYIQDTIVVKGISADRDSNGSNADFQVAKGSEPEGIREYVHKYYTGYQLYYQHRDYEDELIALENIRQSREKRAKKYGFENQDSSAFHWEGLEDSMDTPVAEDKPEKKKGKKNKKKAEQVIDTRTKIDLDEQLDILNENIQSVEMQRNIREITQKMKREMVQLNLRMILKVTIIFKNIGLFTGVDKS